MPPTLFNVIVDAVIRKFYTDVMDNIIAANTGLSGDNVSCLTSLLYADDGAVGSRLALLLAFPYH